jgi:hypothetical protein
MRKCASCGGTRLKRVHRTFWERFNYLAIYECRDCHQERGVSRRYRYHFGAVCRCPKCGTSRLKKLKDRDHVDPMHTGLLHLLERFAGGALYHCCFCRIQFYDRRVLILPLTVGTSAMAAEADGVDVQEEIMTPPRTASSGA